MAAELLRQMTALTQELRRLEHELSQEQTKLGAVAECCDPGTVEWHSRRILRDAKRIGATAEQIAELARRLLPRP
jgi:hypothetical protein